MKICAVICELNPFHNGHAFIFEQARQLSGCDAVLALMSGNFVQRSFPAVIDEYARAECALNCGADAVLELPVVYAVASAEIFAQGAISILNKIADVDCLAMGTESDNFLLIESIARIQADESNSYRSVLRSALDRGLPYPKALTEATATIAQTMGIDRLETEEALRKPNNILAVAYKKALIKTNSKIKFLPVVRAGGDITNNFSGRFSSASAIRGIITDDKIADAMPERAFSILRSAQQKNSIINERFESLMLAVLRLSDANLIKNAPDCAEGMENKIREIANQSASYSELLEKICTSRFTRGRISRICTQTLLGISKQMQSTGYCYSRLLGVRKEKNELLSIFPPSVIINKQSEQYIDEQFMSCFQADKKAAAIYSIITGGRDNGFYKKLLTI